MFYLGFLSRPYGFLYMHTIYSINNFLGSSYTAPQYDKKCVDFAQGLEIS